MVHTFTKCLKTFSKCLNTFSKCINTFSKCLKTFAKYLKTISKCLKTFLKCLCIKTMVIFKSSQSLSRTRRVKFKMTKSCCCSIFPSASSSWFSGLLGLNDHFQLIFSSSWMLIIFNHHIFLHQHHYHHALIWNGEIQILPDLSLSRLSAGCQQVDWTILHAHLDKGWGWYCKGKMPFGKVTICLSLWQLV